MDSTFQKTFWRQLDIYVNFAIFELQNNKNTALHIQAKLRSKIEALT